MDDPAASRFGRLTEARAMVDKEKADGFSKDIAGKGKLDDEMLPNRGEPVPQDPERGSERRDAQGAKEASGMPAGGEQASRDELGDLDMQGGQGAGGTSGSAMRRTTMGDMRDVRETSSLGETGGMGESQIMDRQNREPFNGSPIEHHESEHHNEGRRVRREHE